MKTTSSHLHESVSELRKENQELKELLIKRIASASYPKLYETNKELMKENKELRKFYECWKNEVYKIAINDELLVALKEVNQVSSHHFGGRIQELVEKVISKAERFKALSVS